MILQFNHAHDDDDDKVRCPAVELLCNSLCGPRTKTFGDPYSRECMVFTKRLPCLLQLFADFCNSKLTGKINLKLNVSFNDACYGKGLVIETLATLMCKACYVIEKALFTLVHQTHVTTVQ